VTPPSTALPREVAVAHLEWCTVIVPLSGAIDLDAERTRLRKEIDKSRKEREKLGQKLGNAGFLAKAPAEVVAKDRARLDELAGVVDKLAQSLARLGG